MKDIPPIRTVLARARPRGAWLWVGTIVASLIAAPASIAERRRVLDQIALPHAYYFHEMYLPQLTQGPSSLTWSADSTELIYSMGGTLWRQRLDSTRAVQITDGIGFDYQPDWSADGQRVVYSSYANGAVELWLLEVASGRTRQLTHGGAVNVEPRWSPDGRRIVYVSTAGTGHFHVYVAEVAAEGLAHPVPLTRDVKSPLRRYYYSAYDHEINPTWTRDGSEILFVSNHGHIHGTGGFWRMPAKPGASAREIHYEETNWRARPEFSPDGTMLLYSSYLGRNTHQLWLLPASGGDALPITYGDFDATAARWSPDGRQIAYVVNSGGDLALRVLDFPGHDARALVAAERQTLRPMAELALRIEDEAGRPLAARISISDSRGHPYAPGGAWIYADDSYDRKQMPVEVHYFHARGDVRVTAPAETLTVHVSRGLETPPVERTVTLTPDRPLALTLTLHPQPFTTDAVSRWVSGDAHVHMNYAGSYRNTPRHLAAQAQGEDLAIVNALVVNKEQRFPDIAYGGPEGNVVEPDVLVVHGQEFHTSYWGHLGILHPAGAPQLPGYVGYPNTAAASLMPMNADVADRAHADGALVGYVHPFDELPEPVNRPHEVLTNELPVDVALGKVDYIEVLGFSDHRSTAAVWYRLLNLGFHLPAGAGTDAMADYASLRGPVGLNRVYVQVPDRALNIADWLEGLRAGRTFATNAPLLAFTLAGHGPGSDIELAAPARLPFTARLRSLVPVEHLDIVCDGAVAATLLPDGPQANGDFQGDLSVAHSGWCVLRADAADAPYPVLDNYVYGTTSPVYLRVAGVAPHSGADARFFVAWIERVLATTGAYPDWRSPAEKAAVLARLRAAQDVYRKLE